MTHDTTLHLPHGALALPAFLPDATRGVVRAVDSADLEAIGVEGLVMSIFHLMQRPGATTVKALGGLHAMTGWQRPIVTDSGGFQVYSLIRQNSKFGSLTDRGLVFRPDGKDKVLLTPEKSVQLQLSFGADVVICLDDCTHPDDGEAEQRESVRRTIAWAKRCKAAFERWLAAPRRTREAEEGGAAPYAPRLRASAVRPLLFGVIQGGASKELRKACAEALLEIGFDGFGYGGWPLDSEGALLHDIVAYTRELVPRALPMHALGIGHPDSIIACAHMGYDVFDCALPTRDARRGRLMIFNEPPNRTRFDGRWWSYLYIGDDKHIKSAAPISEHCDCPVCRRYSRGYLHHLFKVKDAAYLRLATLHNLCFMMQLMARLRQIIAEG
ncbi:MAG: tRNA guanosine(34) transglycosylase Tgt [Anaerolineae bacterium]|nr:queuine tRNA-ribosyltransferase family protein [Candidatus Roseilinea sp.]MDW8451699.1 tRNA guanosine(34) transglycosylase Tgt [Anaerolineae bacterium]